MAVQLELPFHVIDGGKPEPYHNFRSKMPPREGDGVALTTIEMPEGLAEATMEAIQDGRLKL